MTSQSSIKRASHQLLQLSREASRIATALAQISDGSGAAPEREAAPAAPEPAVSAAMVAALIRARRARTDHFGAELFADPAWDILLDLFEAELAQRRTAASNLCLASGVPLTTALRWLKVLEEKGLVLRSSDPLDRRRIFVELAPEASDALRQWFGRTFRDLALK